MILLIIFIVSLIFIMVTSFAVILVTVIIVISVCVRSPRFSKASFGLALVAREKPKVDDWLFNCTAGSPWGLVLSARMVVVVVSLS